MNDETASPSAVTTPTYYSEDVRALTRRGRLFHLLADSSWHQSEELADVGGISFHASLYRFRRAGWLVESERRGRQWRYRMCGRSVAGEIG